MVQAGLTAAYALNGEQEMAEKTLRDVLELKPNYPEDPRLPFRTRGMPTEPVECIMSGLRKAGLGIKRAQPENQIFSAPKQIR